MKQVRLQSAWSPSFNLTPMIDVIFQLIIFFLCVTQFQKQETTNEVLLPVAERNLAPEEEPERLRSTINILPDGRLLLGAELTPPDELVERLKRRRESAGRKVVEVWIRADRNTPWQSIEPALEACARAGIWRVAFKVIDPRLVEGT